MRNMSASSRSTTSTRSRITKQPPTHLAAVNAETRETSSPNILKHASEDPNIAAATTALIFPQSHNLFESSPYRPQELSSQPPRSNKRKSSTTGSLNSGRQAVRRKPVSDREVSELLRNDGFQAQHRSPSAPRSTPAHSDTFDALPPSQQSSIRSTVSARQTRSSRRRSSSGIEDPEMVGEWGETIPLHPRRSISAHNDVKQGKNESEEDVDANVTPRASYDSTATPRRSKFVEGTMNNRSMGVASTWYGISEKVGSAGGLSASPSKGTIQDQFKDKPLPAVPGPKSTKRRGRFKFGTQKEDGSNEESTSHKKNLRNNVSMFHFKLFNSDSKDSKSDSVKYGNQATPKASKTAKISKRKAASEVNAEVNLLNERKRKAEEAYAEQFGFKKRSKNHREDTANKPPLTPSAVNATTATTPLTTLRPRKDRLRAPSPGTQPKLKSSTSSRSLRTAPTSLRKRPSRKDLEEENAELRALLARERERNSSIAVNSDPLKDREVKVTMDGRTMNFSSLENIPPVPRLPGKGTLQLLEGNHSRLRPKAEGLFENNDYVEHERRSGEKAIGVKQSFEWPEDVF